MYIYIRINIYSHFIYTNPRTHMVQRDGTLAKSELAGGKNGTNMRYTMEEVRGDIVRW